MRRFLGLFTELELQVGLWGSVALLLIICLAFLFASGKTGSVIKALLIIQLCIVITLVSAVIAKEHLILPGGPAVVIADGVDVRYGPSHDDKVIFHLAVLNLYT